jgi:EF hand domain-containing protein
MCARMRERLQTLAAFAVGAILIGSVEVAKAAEQRVDWTNLANVAVRGNALQKTGGCNGCDDATAVSRQMIRSGDGYVEFAVGESYTFWMAGLSQSDGNVHFNSIDFALRFNANDTVDVMENGQYQGGDSYYQPGDRFRIAVIGGRVRYMQNGNVIFQSRQAPRSPLVFAVALGTMGSSVRSARMETNSRAFTNDDYYNEPDRYARDSFNRLDRNDDGVVTRREWQGTRGEFNALDANRDGVLSTREYSRLSGGGPVVGTSGQLIAVNPAQRWTDTGMWVEAGDMVTFDAEGSIEMSGNNGDTATPAGSRTGRRAADAPLRNQPAGILIARVGNAATFAVGDRRTVRAPVSGELFLGVNDDILIDNRGEYRVSVTVQRR